MTCFTGCRFTENFSIIWRCMEAPMQKSPAAIYDGLYVIICNIASNMVIPKQSYLFHWNLSIFFFYILRFLATNTINAFSGLISWKRTLPIITSNVSVIYYIISSCQEKRSRLSEGTLCDPVTGWEQFLCFFHSESRGDYSMYSLTYNKLHHTLQSLQNLVCAIL